jgi:hypothetical protein
MTIEIKQDLNYWFIDKKPELVNMERDDNRLKALLPVDSVNLKQVRDYFQVKHTENFFGMLAQQYYPSTYPLAISVSRCLEKDLWKFYKTCMVPLTDDVGSLYLMVRQSNKNITWEIADAFYSLGFAVPLWVCDLPDTAGRGLSDQDKELIKACNHSLHCKEVQSKCSIIKNNRYL